MPPRTRRRTRQRAEGALSDVSSGEEALLRSDSPALSAADRRSRQDTPSPRKGRARKASPGTSSKKSPAARGQSRSRSRSPAKAYRSVPQVNAADSPTRLRRSRASQVIAASTSGTAKDASPMRVDDEMDLNSITVYRQPITVARFFAGYVAYKTAQVAKGLVKRRQSVMRVLFVVAAIVLLAQLPGVHQPYMRVIRKAVQWYGYWILLGVLSSVGLGTGLHTFLLFLGPHIAQVTSAAYGCGHLNFNTQTWKKITCTPLSPELHAMTLLQIMDSIKWESFFWGFGTALGELPPYFVAKAANESGKQNEDLRDYDSIVAKPEHQQTWAEWSKVKLMHLMKKSGFWGILAFASIPNPLFDLAGIICGSCGIPFRTFFGATVIGKAIIKTTIQSTFIATLFSKGGRDALINVLDKFAPSFHARAVEFLEAQTKRYLHAPGVIDPNFVQEEQQFSIVGFLWNGFIFLMLAFFLLSIIESLAKRQMRRVLDLSMAPRRSSVHQSRSKANAGSIRAARSRSRSRQLDGDERGSPSPSRRRVQRPYNDE